MYMGDSYKVGQKIDYKTRGGDNIELTVVQRDESDPKYIVSGQKKIDGKVSPSSPFFIARLPSLNLVNAEKAAQSLEQQIKEQDGKNMEEIKKMAKEMGILDSDGEFKLGRHKIFGGRRTRRRKRKRRRKSTKKKRKRRRTKKKRRRRRRKTRK